MVFRNYLYDKGLLIVKSGLYVDLNHPLLHDEQNDAPPLAHNPIFYVNLRNPPKLLSYSSAFRLLYRLQRLPRVFNHAIAHHGEELLLR